MSAYSVMRIIHAGQYLHHLHDQAREKIRCHNRNGRVVGRQDPTEKGGWDGGLGGVAIHPKEVLIPDERRREWTSCSTKPKIPPEILILELVLDGRDPREESA